MKWIRRNCMNSGDDSSVDVHGDTLLPDNAIGW